MKSSDWNIIVKWWNNLIIFSFWNSCEKYLGGWETIHEDTSAILSKGMILGVWFRAFFPPISLVANFHVFAGFSSHSPPSKCWNSLRIHLRSSYIVSLHLLLNSLLHSPGFKHHLMIFTSLILTTSLCSIPIFPPASMSSCLPRNSK